MKLMSTLSWLVLVASCTASAADLSPEELQRICTSPHRDVLYIKELAVYPCFREYRVQVTIIDDQGERKAPIVIAREKLVDGKYIVSEFTPQGSPGPCFMIVTFDRELGCYVQWSIPPPNTFSSSRMLGIGDLEKRVVAFSCIREEPASHVMGIAWHTESGTTWVSTAVSKGKLQWSERGEAEGIESSRYERRIE